MNIDAAPGSMLTFERERLRDINIEAAIGEDDKALTFYEFNKPDERSVPVPLPYLKSMASPVASRMIASIVSSTLWMKHSLPCGYSSA